MCEPVSMGIAIGAATGAAGAAITGGDPLQGAIMGGVTGGFTGGMGGLDPGSLSSSLGRSMLQTPAGFTTFIGSSGVTTASLLGATTIGLGTSIGTGLLMPQQDYSQYYQGAYGAADPIAYNTQQSVVTGSGGRQASAVLAEEIKRAKKRRAAQADVGDLDLATSLSNTGLQIA